MMNEKNDERRQANTEARLSFEYAVHRAKNVSWVDVWPTEGDQDLFPPGYSENGCSSAYPNIRALLYIAAHHIRGELEDQNMALPREMAFTGPDGQTLVLPVAPY